MNVLRPSLWTPDTLTANLGKNCFRAKRDDPYRPRPSITTHQSADLLDHALLRSD
jgi:hypothetical protein